MTSNMIYVEGLDSIFDESPREVPGVKNTFIQSRV